MVAYNSTGSDNTHTPKVISKGKAQTKVTPAKVVKKAKKKKKLPDE